MRWCWWFVAIVISLNLGLSLRLWRASPTLPPHSRVLVHRDMPYVNTQPLPLIVVDSQARVKPQARATPHDSPGTNRVLPLLEHTDPEPKAASLSTTAADFQAGVVQPLPVEPEARGARVTLFTLPRSMLGEAGLRQRIAISSWLKLRPRPYILLMGDDPGVGEYAREIGVTWVPDIAKNEFGTPLLSSCWERAHHLAPTRTRVFINTDIVLFDGFTEAVAACELHYKEDFFMSGQRTTVRVRPEDVPLEQPDWLAWLYAKSSDPELATPDTLDAVDYFAFTSGLLQDIPPFAIGRYSWDSWILHHLVVTLADTVDASEAVRIAHLAHEVHSKMTGSGNTNVLENPEVRENRRLAGGSTHMGNLQHSWDVLAPCDAAVDESCHGFRFKPKQRRWRSPGNKKFVFINNTTITDRNEAIEAVRHEREEFFRKQELKNKKQQQPT